MKAFFHLFKQIKAQLHRLFIQPYRTRIVKENLPTRLKQKTIYLFQEDSCLEYAAILCPCGCGQILYMNLIPDERPCWRVTQHPNGTASLHPSVWRKKDCQSHFWFSQGRVYWCEPQ